jgi:hypothetical protein
MTCENAERTTLTLVLPIVRLEIGVINSGNSAVLRPDRNNHGFL